MSGAFDLGCFEFASFSSSLIGFADGLSGPLICEGCLPEVMDGRCQPHGRGFYARYFDHSELADSAWVGGISSAPVLSQNGERGACAVRPACGLTLAPLQPRRVRIVRHWSWRRRFCDLGSDGLAVYDLVHLWAGLDRMFLLELFDYGSCVRVCQAFFAAVTVQSW